MDGSDDAVDCRRPCHIYRERQSSECTGACPNARISIQSWCGTIQQFKQRFSWSLSEVWSYIDWISDIPHLMLPPLASWSHGSSVFPCIWLLPTCLLAPLFSIVQPCEVFALTNTMLGLQTAVHSSSQWSHINIDPHWDLHPSLLYFSPPQGMHSCIASYCLLTTNSTRLQ